MGLLDRLLGRTHDSRSFHGVPGHPGSAAHDAGQQPGKHGYSPAADQAPTGTPAAPATGAGHASGAHRDADEVAVERYRYLLRTAPPDAVEQAHAEAFARLTPQQRRQVLDELGSAVPPAERATSDDPQQLARMATRAEMRSPGTLEQTFRGAGDPGTGRGPGFGSMVGASLLGTVAGVVIGSAVAGALFGPAFGDPTQDLAGADAGTEGAGAGEGDGATTEAAAGDGGVDGGFDGGDLGGGFDAGFGDLGGF